MTQEDYRAALAAAIKEYEELGLQRRQIDDRLAQLAQTIGTQIASLKSICVDPAGISSSTESSDAGWNWKLIRQQRP